MVRVTAIALVLAASWPVAPSAAAATSMPEEGEKPCQSGKAKARSRLFGDALGALASRALGRSSIAGIVSVNSVSQTLTDAIACRLDRQEQRQAARATDVAVTRGVGASEAWTSETRAGVSGSSTVQTASTGADGTRCLTVKDVVIVDGEETTVDKRMCRAPGASGYTVAV